MPPPIIRPRRLIEKYPIHIHLHAQDIRPIRIRVYLQQDVVYGPVGVVGSYVSQGADVGVVFQFGHLVEVGLFGERGGAGSGAGV